MLSIRISPDTHYKTLIGEIIKRISLIYGITLKEGDIKDIEIEQTGKIVQEADIVTQPIYDKTKLILNLANPARQLKKVSTKDYNSFLRIFKEGEKDPVTFKYRDIGDLTFEQLYTSKLQQKESKMKKNAIYMLKIMDVIIKPKEKLSKAEHYFKN